MSERQRDEHGRVDSRKVRDSRARGYAYIAALLGSHESWDGAADFLEHIAEHLDLVQQDNKQPNVSSNSPKVLAYWRRKADALGIEHDGEAEPDDELERFPHRADPDRIEYGTPGAADFDKEAYEREVKRVAAKLAAERDTEYDERGAPKLDPFTGKPLGGTA